MIDESKLLQKYRNMVQYKNLSESELKDLVQKKVSEEVLLTAFVGLGDDEIKKAIKLYDQYITEHSFEGLAEKSTLINTVRDEILKERILMQIKDDYDNKDNANSLRLFEEVRDLETHILSQKEKLGMLRDANSETAQDLFNELKEKCLKYYEEHAAEFYSMCPNCKELFPSILPPDKLESTASSWFKNTTLYNYEVFDAYHKKEITIDRAAKILGVHPEYITKMYNEIYLKEKNDSQS